jgi:hypothetical protein
MPGLVAGLTLASSNARSAEFTSAFRDRLSCVSLGSRSSKRVGSASAVLRFASVPDRKAWMSEDLQMAIFDAAALALVFFGCAGRELVQDLSVRAHELT